MTSVRKGGVAASPFNCLPGMILGIDVLLLTAALSAQKGLDLVNLGHFEKQRRRPCYVLAFLPFVFIPEHFSRWNLAKMNFKDTLKG